MTSARQASAAFSNPYTNPALEKVGIVRKKNNVVDLDTAGVTVGVLSAQSFTQPFLEDFAALSPMIYDDEADLQAAIAAGTIDLVFTAQTESTNYDSSTYEFVIVDKDYVGGVSFGCHPKHGDILTKINHALDAVKDSPAWTALCAQYPSINCDVKLGGAWSTYLNAAPNNPHPTTQADIVIATDASWDGWSGLTAGKHEGFLVDLTRDICDAENLVCAFVTAPTKSIMADAFTQFSVTDNSKAYPGWGTQSRWYHCAMGIRRTVANQRSMAFSNPIASPDNSGPVSYACHPEFGDLLQKLNDGLAKVKASNYWGSLCEGILI
jgi:ABC-type amino acid transport substrate-binding protein